MVVVFAAKDINLSCWDFQQKNKTTKAMKEVTKAQDL